MEAKSESKSEKRESRDPRSRDPRRKNKTEDKKDVKAEKKQDVTAPAPPIIRDETVKASKEKKDRSPSRKSSTNKSDSKKSSSSKSSKSSSHSSSKSSSSKSSSNNSSRSKEEKENTAVKAEKIDPSNRKRTRDSEVSLSPSPTRDGRISPLPPPSQNLGRIPKVGRTSGGSFGDSLASMDTQESEKKRGNKRPGSGGKISPPPEKRNKPLFIE